MEYQCELKARRMLAPRESDLIDDDGIRYYRVVSSPRRIAAESAKAFFAPRRLVYVAKTSSTGVDGFVSTTR